MCVCNHDSISACFDHKFSGIWGAKNCTVLPKSKIEERYNELLTFMSGGLYFVLHFITYMGLDAPDKL